MPGMGEEMEGAMQHAPQPARQSNAFPCVSMPQLCPKSPRQNGDFLGLDGLHGLPSGMPGIGEVMLGAMQHAPQSGRQLRPAMRAAT